MSLTSASAAAGACSGSIVSLTRAACTVPPFAVWLSQRYWRQISSPVPPVRRDGPRNPLERHVAHRLEPDAVDGRPGLLADEHLMRARVVGDPRRDVDRPAEEVAFLLDHRARVDADACGPPHGVLGLLQQFQPAEDRIPRLAEVEHPPVAEPLHG